MRRQWYLGFGVVLLGVLLTLIMLQDGQWFLVLLVPIVALWIYDLVQKKHAILRNFPVLGHARFILEFFRPEIQQYFIASDESERPFNRETRSIIYQRAKNVRDTVPFGTEKDVNKIGYTWVLHSLAPKVASEVEPRIHVGRHENGSQPYCASRLNISAMSFGSLSPRAIMALNKGAQLGHFAQNTGEGGLSPYHLQGGDIIFQIGTAYFGCRDDEGHFDEKEFQAEALKPQVKMIEIKLSQGAKPSHGGILPAAKLTAEIAKVRKVPLGHNVISPPAHTAFDSPIGLLHFIKRLRHLSEQKPVGFKLCIGRKKEFLSICKAMLQEQIYPDFITVDGAEGGTGAAPLEYTNHVGEPLEAALVFVHNALVGVNLRDKIRIIASGKVATGFDLAEKIALGADMCNAARAMMMSVGCVQSKQCDANTCPTGVATQNWRLQRGLVVEEKKWRAANFHKNTMKSFLELVGAMGLENPSDLKPEYFMRRVSAQSVKSLAEVHEYLEAGALLQATLPASFKPHWEDARADAF
ncbi:MAG: FMN-binding glutamate synthase family protein [Legionellaceae bacterium]|nr:FMN-binding glutamate synthase family protein [Legionellaceae bacterium]HAF86955.1 FMN-binding glutamate synthase family protein [Legionellales bacterium]HCA88994.1 FMN-binding glutamate synthase family protein [Legionellales bacterium]|tara:strand:- start:286 stop:1860 length:1575 start_codon:yes stop_codon:yes gene_type:complete